ncbi:MAG: cupin domain-containing protein [Polyangiales bacterium]
MAHGDKNSTQKNFPALAKMLGPHSVASFMDDYWEKAPLYVPRSGDGPVKPLVSLSDMDAILTARPHRHPDMQIVSASQDISPDDYTDANDYIDPTRAARLFARGGTIILNHLDESSRAVRDVCAALEGELGIQVQANTYFTPGGAQGFPAHYDSHDVIVVQCVGRKTWRLYDSPKGLPMRGESFERATTPVGPISAEFTTGPGEALYIPRGLIHDAVAADEGASLHVTFGFHGVRWSEVMIEAMANLAMQDDTMRQSIPLGALVGRADLDALREGLRERVQRLAAAASFELVQDKLVQRFAGVRKESLEGIFQDAVSPITAETVFATRPGALVVLDATADAVTLTINGRSTRWPAHAEASLRKALSALEADTFTLNDLGDSLDEAGRRTLLRRLLNEGALRIVR